LAVPGDHDLVNGPGGTMNQRTNRKG